MPELGRILLKIQKMDIGVAKKSRMRSFVNEAFRKKKQDSINLKKLRLMSKKQIMHEKYKL